MEQQKSDLLKSKRIFHPQETKVSICPHYDVKDFLKKLGIDVSALQK